MLRVCCWLQVVPMLVRRLEEESEMQFWPSLLFFPYQLSIEQVSS